jgi:serine protease Do
MTNEETPTVTQRSPAPAWAGIAAALLLCAGVARAEESRAAATSPVLHELNTAVAKLVARVSPAVVQVRVTGYGPAAEGGVEGPLVARQRTIGSGVIVDPSGYVLTNAHVIHGAQRIQVVLPGKADGERGAPGTRQRIYEARVVGTQPGIDLALLRIQATGLPTIPLDPAAKVRQGELVFAIGSPQGLASTVTMGVVSSAARQMDMPTPLAIPMLLIQTDAPINPGNSGGPLVNADGVLVGINTFIFSQSGGNQGLGFAIPAPMVRFAYDSLRRYGHVRRIEAGISAQAVTPTLAAGLGLARDWGVVVADVGPGTAAFAAGVKPGDVIETFDGHVIDSLPALTGALFLHPVEEPVSLGILRGDERLTILVDAPEAKQPTDQLADLANPDKGLVPRLGILGVDVTEKLGSILPPLRIPGGVVVAARTVEGTSQNVGLQPGDVIHAVNQAPIPSLESLRQVIQAFKPGDSVVLYVERQGRLTYLPFEID